MLERYVSYALQPVAAVVLLTLPDGAPFELPDSGMTRPLSAASKAGGILGSGTALMSIPIDDVMQRELPDIEDRTIATPSGPHVKLPVRCGVLVTEAIAMLSLRSTTSPQNRVLVESPSCREIYRELLAIGGPDSQAWLVRENDWEPFPSEETAS